MDAYLDRLVGLTTSKGSSKEARVAKPVARNGSSQALGPRDTTTWAMDSRWVNSRKRSPVARLR